jgi:hypothetical protein
MHGHAAAQKDTGELIEGLVDVTRPFGGNSQFALSAA